jgi:uncharacterized membrane protein
MEIEITFKEYFSQDLLDDFSVSNNCIIVFEDLFGNQVNSYLTIYVIIGLRDKYDIILEENTRIQISLYLFYSLKDLTIAFSLFIMLPYYNRDRKGLSQLRRITGKIELTDTTFAITTLFVVHIYGLCALETGVLKKMALSCGLKIEEKSSLDEYKACMDMAIKEKPETFLLYSLND